jgi:hypothetical protein
MDTSLQQQDLNHNSDGIMFVSLVNADTLSVATNSKKLCLCSPVVEFTNGVFQMPWDFTQVNNNVDKEIIESTKPSYRNHVDI